MEKNNELGKNVTILYGLDNRDKKDRKEATVFPFNKETIHHVVSTDITCANYRIGAVNNNDDFIVHYAGRVTGEGLHQRLIEHLDEYEPQENFYFQFMLQNNEIDAYHQECEDYHAFQDFDEDENKRVFRNKIHPAKPSNSSVTCRICGK